MTKLTFTKVFVSVAIMFAFLQTAAMAGDSKKTTHPKPQYKKMTGEVVSAGPASVVIKGRAKAPLTVAVNDKTDMLGAKALKAGDRVAVNYRVEKSGNTATRIKVLSVSAKAVATPADPAPTAASPKPN